MGGPFPQDVLVLVGTVFVTFSLWFFDGTAFVPRGLMLTPAVWERGWIWQLATYPFVGVGAPDIWFLIELAILLFFARDVYGRLGREGSLRLLAWATLSASTVAVVVALLSAALSDGAGAGAFVLMQGQRMLLAIVVAAFATLFRHATILLFFVVPVQARWFLWIEILLAFMGFLGTHDLAGFLGVCTAVGMTYSLLTVGSPRWILRDVLLRFEQRRLRLKLAWLRRRRGMRVVPGSRRDDGPSRGPWVH